MLDVKLLEQFFLKAALETYASGSPESTIAELPGSKVYRYEQGDLLYLDMYWTCGEFSGGKTLIWDRAVSDRDPVWMMDYDGWCKNDDKRVQAFLKRVLSAQYANGVFCGGRGPREFRENLKDPRGLVYQNHPNPLCQRFDFFEGREEIWRWCVFTDILFWHRYRGLLLGSRQ